MRFFWAALAYVLAVSIVATVAFLVVMFLAGPHAGLLPEFVEAAVQLPDKIRPYAGLSLRFQ